MAEITREHLELAALAAGIRPDRSRKSGALSGFDGFDITGALVTDWHNGVTWRPHLDDGDAARLAAEVGMKIIAPKHSGDGAFAEPLDGRSPSVTVYRKDRAEQMRHAIVLCAAAVGERMKGGA